MAWVPDEDRLGFEGTAFRQVYAFGDEVTIRVSIADILKRRLEFELLVK